MTDSSPPEAPQAPIVLSHYQATPLLRARRDGLRTARTSPDLGLTYFEAALGGETLRYPSGEHVPWAEIELIADEGERGRLSDRCYYIAPNGEAQQIRTFSRRTNRHYSLLPTNGAPTMVIAGFPMHRIKGLDPHQDTLAKVRAAGDITGRVLDTATGLGYTAIEAARTAEHVVTVELDPTGLEIARLNPWSRDLFNNPRIEQIVGDSYEVVEGFDTGAFTVVIHDPPAFSLAGELYSGEFYRRLHRVLQRGGRLFHYIGNPERTMGARVTKGVVRRLQDAGFKRVEHRPQAFGVLAHK